MFKINEFVFMSDSLLTLYKKGLANGDSINDECRRFLSKVNEVAGLADNADALPNHWKDILLAARDVMIGQEVANLDHFLHHPNKDHILELYGSNCPGFEPSK